MLAPFLKSRRDLLYLKTGEEIKGQLKTASEDELLLNPTRSIWHRISRTVVSGRDIGVARSDLLV